MKKYWRWLFVLFSVLLAFGCGYLLLQFGGKNISGVVTDLTGKPIPNAEVSVNDKIIKTKDDGSFIIHVPSGENVITATYDNNTGNIVLPEKGFSSEITDPLAVNWGPGDIGAIFESANSEGGLTEPEVEELTQEINNGYYPKPPVSIPQNANGQEIINVVIPTLLDKPVLPPLVAESDFVVNDEGIDVVKGEILVGWLDGTNFSERENIIKQAGGEIRYDSPTAQTTIIYVDNQNKVPAVVEALEKSDKVSAAMQNYRLRSQEILQESPDDPAYNDKNKSWWLKAINVEPMWEITKRGNSVIVVVIDSGFDTTHPDLQGVFTEFGMNYTDQPLNSLPDHGTHVSGILAALRNNKIGSAGVSNKVVIFPFKLYDFGRLVAAFDEINSYNNVHIVSMSQGWNWIKVNQQRIKNGHPPFTEKQMEKHNNRFNLILKPSFERFYKDGGVMCQSAGNDYGFDAKLNAVVLQGTIVVGSSDVNGGLTNFSNIGDRIDIVAPGSNIWSTVSGGKYKYMNGTSMSTPVTCGVIAEIRSMRPSYGALMIRQILRMGGRQPKNLSAGYIHLDGWRALLRAVNMFGVKGDVYKGHFEMIKDAIITTKPLFWTIMTDDKGEYLIPYLKRIQWVLFAESGDLEGHENVFPPNINSDEIRTISIYIEGEKEEEEGNDSENNKPETDEFLLNDEGTTTDGESAADDSNSNNQSIDGQSNGQSVTLPNGIVLSSSGCAESGFEKPKQEDEKCPPGFYFSRDSIACEQTNCPSGAGRTYTLECKCPDNTQAIYSCEQPGYVVTCK